MDLKEYIKSLVREMLDEQEGGAVGNTTAAVPGYLTPRAFSKGKGKNVATKTAEKQGMKVTKGETTMPADSKVRDYKSLWPSSKKKKVKIYELGREDVDTEFSVTTKDGKTVKATYKGIRRDGELMFDPGVNVGEIITIHPKDIDTKVKKINEFSDYDKKSQHGAASGYTGPSLATKAVKESLQTIIKEELLNEVTYNRFKNEVKYRTKAEQLHKAIREVKRKLQEIDRIVEYTHRMKQELSEGDGIQYWNRTNNAVAAISEMVNQLNNKIKNLQQ